MRPIRRATTVAALICAVGGSGAAMAATETQKQDAIDGGLTWLANQQQADGRWLFGGTGGTDDIAATGAVLLSFLEEGHTPTSGTTYSTAVSDGLNFLLNSTYSTAIGPQPAGNPDTNGNGLGIHFDDNGAFDSRGIYATGMALPAVVLAAPDLNTTTITGASAAVNGKTYGQVIQDTVDYMAYAQVDAGAGRGGWRYTPNYPNSDNSVSQWPALALLYAGSAGIDAPDFVKDELDHWIHYSQNTIAEGGNGGAGYTHPSQTTPTRTGSLLVQMEYDGYSIDDPTPSISQPVKDAVAYLNNMWFTNGTTGAFGDLYGMWAQYKGLEVMIGLDDDTYITNERGCGTQDAGDVCNWWEDMNEWLVNAQSTSGSENWWATGGFGNNILNTAWAINILQAVAIPPENGDHKHIPEPGTLALFAAGLLGAGAMRRRRRLQV